MKIMGLLETYGGNRLLAWILALVGVVTLPAARLRISDLSGNCGGCHYLRSRSRVDCAGAAERCCEPCVGIPRRFPSLASRPVRACKCGHRDLDADDARSSAAHSTVICCRRLCRTRRILALHIPADRPPAAGRGLWSGQSVLVCARAERRTRICFRSDLWTVSTCPRLFAGAPGHRSSRGADLGPSPGSSRCSLPSWCRRQAMDSRPRERHPADILWPSPLCCCCSSGKR